MPAVVDNYLGGTFRFVKAWQKDGSGHLVMLENGSYAHAGGQPITDRRLFKKIMDEPDDIRKAEEWFDNKEKPVSQPTRFIMNLPDGSFKWSDGETIKDWEEVLGYYANGVPQDFVIWWAEELKRREKNPKIVDVARTIRRKQDSGERVIRE